MSSPYHRFENTLIALRDWLEWFDDRDNKGEPVKLSSIKDALARERLLELVCEIAADFGGMKYGED